MSIPILQILFTIFPQLKHWLSIYMRPGTFPYAALFLSVYLLMFIRGFFCAVTSSKEEEMIGSCAA